MVGVDPSDNIHQNEFAHERVKSTIEEYTTDQSFDLATLRMVVEHVQRPELAVAALARLVKPGGKVVIYTPNRWSVSSLVASMTSHGLHQRAAHFLWRAKEEDVFPTVYQMNTRESLRTVFLNGGFREVGFAYLADCSILQRFRLLYRLELTSWRLWRMFGIRYPENNLLGVYERDG
jgi:SAM-dependent methyltransferase